MEVIRVAKSGQSHSDEEWEKIRPVFISLYKADGKHLSEVRTILAQDYGFFATERQYKTRILKWGAVKKEAKNNKASRPQNKASRRAQDTRDFFVVPLPKLHLQRVPSPPGHLGHIHVATHGVGTFYSGVLHPGVDVFRVLNQTNEWNIRQFFDVSNAVSGLAAASRWKEAQPLYGEMLDHVGPLLGDRNPIVLICLLQICCRFLQQGQGAVLQRFLSFVARMAVAQHQESHPLRLLSSAWSQSTAHYPLDLMTVCAQQAVDILNSELGPEHAQTLSARRALNTALFAKGDHRAAIESVAEVAEIETRLYPDSFATFDIQVRVIKSQLAMDDLESAEASLERMKIAKVEFEAKNPNPALVHKLNLSTDELRAELLRLRMDPAAIPIIKEALARARKAVEVRDLWVIIVAEEKLAAAQESLRTGSPPKRLQFPC